MPVEDAGSTTEHGSEILRSETEGQTTIVEVVSRDYRSTDRLQGGRTDISELLKQVPY